jgi:hypothetical protein
MLRSQLSLMKETQTQKQSVSKANRLTAVADQGIREFPGHRQLRRRTCRGVNPLSGRALEAPRLHPQGWFRSYESSANETAGVSVWRSDHKPRFRPI